MTGIKIIEVACHRNGCEGEPFYAIRFTDAGELLLALVFERPQRLVVIDPVLAATTVAFAQNSWRGDVYENALRRAITAFERNRAIQETSAPLLLGSVTTVQ